MDFKIEGVPTERRAALTAFLQEQGHDRASAQLIVDMASQAFVESGQSVMNVMLRLDDEALIFHSMVLAAQLINEALKGFLDAAIAETERQGGSVRYSGEI